MPQNKHSKYSRGWDPLPGQPGYRTRSGRTGFDPLDTPAEEAHMEGLFFRNLFTLRLRTRNPFYLALMFIFGVPNFLMSAYFLVGMLGEAIEVMKSNPSDWAEVVVPVLAMSAWTSLPTALVVNLGLSIRDLLPKRASGGPIRPSQNRGRRKKQPKRRKDYH